MTSLPGRVVLAVCGGAVLASTAIAALTGDGLRYTADSLDTIPWWQPWAPVAAGTLAAMAVRRPAGDPDTPARPLPQAWVLVACGLAFAALLIALGAAEPNYSVLKLVLLLAVPLAMFALARRIGDRWPSPTARPGWSPAPAVIAYLAVYLALAGGGPSFLAGLDPATAVITLLAGFAMNALLEEVFYRRWLLTRWRAVLGPWPAIALSSVVWASWHIAIQGSGDVPRDAVNVLANQGVSGLFLGFLWVRYRVMWPLLVIHGVWNANPLRLLG